MHVSSHKLCAVTNTTQDDGITNLDGNVIFVRYADIRYVWEEIYALIKVPMHKHYDAVQFAVQFIRSEIKERNDIMQ